MSDDPKPTDPTPDPKPDPQPDPPKTFTQEEVNRFLAEDRRKHEQKYGDYDDLKKKAGEFDKLQESQQTDLEKAQKLAAKAQEDASKLRVDLQETRVRSAVLTEAAKKKVVDPEAAVALLDRSSLEYDDDGMPTNITKVMDALIENKPYLVQGTGPKPGSADQGARPSAPNQISSTQGMDSGEISKALQEGRLDEYLKSRN